MTKVKGAGLALAFGVAVFVGVVVSQSLRDNALTTDTLIAAIVAAITTGSIYAIAASGLVLTYTTSGVFNFAQGAIGMSMAFLYWQLRVDWGWPAPLALILVIGLAAPLVGAGIERGLMRRLVNAQLVVQVVVSLGLMFFFLGVTQLIWNQDDIIGLPHFFEGKGAPIPGLDHQVGLTIGGTLITWHRLTTILVAILIAAFLRLLLYRSRTGVAMRAVVDNRALAGLTGARPGRSAALAWALGCSMAAIAGILYAPDSGLRYDSLTLFIVDAFAAAIIGRLRSLPLTYVGGLIIGFAVSFQVSFLSWGGRWAYASTAIPAAILFVALLAVPQARIELGRLAPKHRVPQITSVRETALGMAVLFVVVWLVATLIGNDIPNLNRVTLAIITSCIMLSLVPLTGWAGQISLAQITFVGAGAWAMSEVAGKAGDWFAPGSPLGLLAGAIVAVPFGVLMALPALRLQGLYLALASMAFAVMAVPLFFDQPDVFGQSGPRIARLDLFGIQFDTQHQKNFLLACTVIFGALACFVVWLRRSRFGRRLIALRDSPAACATVGVNLLWTKLAVFALAAAMAGFAGALLGMHRGTATTMDFEMLVGVPFLLLLVVGGVGTVSGALFGGIAFVLLLIVQNEVTWVVVGVSVFVALTRLGPGLAALGVGRAPEGAAVEIGAAFSALLPWRHDARETLRAERAMKRAAKGKAPKVSANGAGEAPDQPAVPAGVGSDAAEGDAP
ncbi:MAG: ABC transporter permease [Acidimicrobiia bacterium]